MLINFQRGTGVNLFLTNPQRIVKKQNPRMGDVFAVCGLVAFYRVIPTNRLYTIKAGKKPIELCTCVNCERFDLYVMRSKKGSCAYNAYARMLRQRTNTR